MFLRSAIFIFFLMLYSLPLAFAKDVIVVNSVPKSGTHLVTKCIEILTGKKADWIGRAPFPKGSKLHPTGVDVDFIQQKIDALPDNKFFFTHLTYADAFNDFSARMNYKCFFVYRDPRAQLVSLAHWRVRLHSNKGLSLDEAILSLINQPLLYAYEWNNINGVTDLYNAYMPWARSPHFCVIRFEDLVGPQGGGDKQKQCLTVKKIAQHLGLSIDDATLDLVCGQLFGDTYSFHEGQISGWKNYFTPEHTQLFKQHAGKLLVDLGYEKDLNW
jgi:sulfotransferase 6B1